MKKQPENFGAQERVVGEYVAERKGKADDPLPRRDRWNDTIDPVRCGIGHATSAARRADTATLAGEGNRTFVATAFAAKTQEAMPEDSASQECLDLPSNEPGNDAVLLLGMLEKRSVVLLDHAMQ